MISQSQLLELVDCYALATGRSDKRVSTLVFSDNKRVESLRAGKQVYISTVEKAWFWFHENWPDTYQWPIGIDRPKTGCKGVTNIEIDANLAAVLQVVANHDGVTPAEWFTSAIWDSFQEIKNTVQVGGPT